MEWFTVLEKLWPILGIPILAYTGYIHRKIERMNEKLNTMTTKQEVREEMDNRIEFLKEKIEDNINPIYHRLDQLDDILERIYNKLDK